jgi:glycosyltransferase involved in cell wall biosynthesis
MSDQLRARLGDLGVAEYAELRGYVPLREGLGPLYRDSAMFLHISWTEGLPQVLFEAFAAALPVVATDVGGIAEAAGDAVSLVPPGDPDAAAAALRELRDHNALRRTRIVAGNALARRTTIESECSRVADFIAGA